MPSARERLGDGDGGARPARLQLAEEGGRVHRLLGGQDAGLLDLAQNGTPGAFPDLNNAAFAEYQNNFLTPKMIQRIVVDKISIDQAIKETQTACQLIYDKNNK